jgi:hypothetical protein
MKLIINPLYSGRGTDGGFGDGRRVLASAASSVSRFSSLFGPRILYILVVYVLVVSRLLDMMCRFIMANIYWVSPSNKIAWSTFSHRRQINIVILVCEALNEEN